MKHIRLVLLVCVGFGTGMIVDRGAVVLSRPAKAEMPRPDHHLAIDIRVDSSLPTAGERVVRPDSVYIFTFRDRTDAQRAGEAGYEAVLAKEIEINQR